MHTHQNTHTHTPQTHTTHIHLTNTHTHTHTHTHVHHTYTTQTSHTHHTYTHTHTHTHTHTPQHTHARTHKRTHTHTRTHTHIHHTHAHTTHTHTHTHTHTLQRRTWCQGVWILHTQSKGNFNYDKRLNRFRHKLYQSRWRWVTVWGCSSQTTWARRRWTAWTPRQPVSARSVTNSVPCSRHLILPNAWFNWRFSHFSSRISVRKTQNKNITG